ncbi:hypothetical protein MJO29_013932 [Puccinia striiformis f. sp. tritici]|nr:hypothetical protein MJO29_013932 [Puccinia striiformis f. sp. tritici]
MRAVVVYGALLTLVIGTPATFTGARLTRRMESAISVGNDAKSVAGSKIFTHAALQERKARPEESGLTLMEFRERAGREMDVDSKHIDCFVNEYLSGFMEEELHNEKFELQGLYKEHLDLVKSNKNIDVQALGELLEQNNEHPEKTLFDYPSRVDGEVFTRSKANEFVDWKLAQKWRSQYKDTEELDVLVLLEDYMDWAGEDSRLKDNIYVKEWQKNYNLKENETIKQLVERLTPPRATENAG